MDIRCISLMEPWASFVAQGHKRIETRSWATSYRGLLGIHASKSTKYLKDGFPDKKCEEAGLYFRFGPEYPWPLGKILCVTNLVSCERTHLMRRPDPRELALGDYSFTSSWKRYGLKLSAPRLLDPPVSCPGALSLWKPSKDLLDRILESLTRPGELPVSIA